MGLAGATAASGATLPVTQGQQGQAGADQAASGAAEQQPADLDALRQQALEEGQAGKTDSAIRDYRRALELDPGWKEGAWNLGMLEYGSSQFPAARATFDKVVGFAPNLGSAWSLLGLCEFETGSYSDALTHLEKAQSLGVDDADIARVSTYHLGLLLIHASEFDRASDLLQRNLGHGNMSSPRSRWVLPCCAFRCCHRNWIHPARRWCWPPERRRRPEPMSPRASRTWCVRILTCPISTMPMALRWQRMGETKMRDRSFFKRRRSPRQARCRGSR
jgi:hypothetical protein